jgi:hypothetical protein
LGILKAAFQTLGQEISFTSILHIRSLVFVIVENMAILRLAQSIFLVSERAFRKLVTVVLHSCSRIATREILQMPSLIGIGAL